MSNTPFYPFVPRKQRSRVTREPDAAGRWTPLFPDMIGEGQQGGGQAQLEAGQLLTTGGFVWILFTFDEPRVLPRQRLILVVVRQQRVIVGRRERLHRIGGNLRWLVVVVVQTRSTFDPAATTPGIFGATVGVSGPEGRGAGVGAWLRRSADPRTSHTIANIVFDFIKFSSFSWVIRFWHEQRCGQPKTWIYIPNFPMEVIR